MVAYAGWRYQLRCGGCGHVFVGAPPGDDLYRFIVQREHRLDGYEAREQMDHAAWQAWKLETYRRLGLKLRLLQYTQPPRATVPSTFGQVKPPSTLTLCTRSPNWRRRKNL